MSPYGGFGVSNRTRYVGSRCAFKVPRSARSDTRQPLRRREKCSLGFSPAEKWNHFAAFGFRLNRKNMENWRSSFTNMKRNIALRLASGERGGSYDDAVVILCAAIGALAADVRRGKTQDRKKYIEVLVAFACALGTARISIPLLVASLRKQKQDSQADILENAFLNFGPTQVLTGDLVDKPEQEVVRLCPSLGLREIRRFSYANLLYKEIRCGYVHEYAPGDQARAWALSVQELWFSTTIRSLILVRKSCVVV